MNKEQARALLQEHGLRATSPRVAVLLTLAASAQPLSYTEVLERLDSTDWDPATVFRNLVKLRQAGLAPVASRAEGIDRYALSIGGANEHHHAHFLCESCGQVSCLPSEFTAGLRMEGLWATSIARAVVQLRGECPDCIRS